MKVQLIAFTAVVLQSAVPGALSAEPHLRAPSGPKPKKDVSMLISTADAAVAVTADYEEEKARSGALSSAEPHIRAPSGPKAKGDIKVAILAGTCVECETMPTQVVCEFLGGYCIWKKKTWFGNRDRCKSSCTDDNNCSVPCRSYEGEGHFDLNEAMEEKGMFDSSEDMGSEFEDYE